MRVLLDDDGFAKQLAGFEHTAFRLELQPAYNVPSEADTVARFLAGDPQPPTEEPALAAWLHQVASQVAERKRIERVRVHGNPPTPYQRWLRWIEPWNTDAGEVIRYLTRQRAQEIGLLPDVGTDDWWLFDSCSLMIMRYDADGRRVETELVTSPERVVRACAWRDLALHHSAPSDNRR